MLRMKCTFLSLWYLKNLPGIKKKRRTISAKNAVQIPYSPLHGNINKLDES